MISPTTSCPQKPSKATWAEGMPGVGVGIGSAFHSGMSEPQTLA